MMTDYPLRITGFLDFFRRPVFWKLENMTFWKLDLFPSSGEGGKIPTQLRPLKRSPLIEVNYGIKHIPINTGGSFFGALSGRGVRLIPHLHPAPCFKYAWSYTFTPPRLRNIVLKQAREQFTFTFTSNHNFVLVFFFLFYDAGCVVVKMKYAVDKSLPQ
jgi:hypothetical protein